MSNKDYKNLALNVLLVLGSILIGVVILELIVRPHNLKFENLILRDGGDLIDKYYKNLFRYDDDLGWVPIPHVSVKKWGGRASTLDDGIRSNGLHSAIDNDISILALGDSFTFGDEVSDENTWPAFLQQRTHSIVYNGGVSSYGIDQIVLRSDGLIKKYDPHVVIFSIVADDVHRCVQRIRHGDPKPYFILKNDELSFQHQEPCDGTRLDLFRRIFGYSYVCHRAMGFIFPEYWWSGTHLDFRSVTGDPVRISELLFDKFIKFAQKRDIIFLIQGSAYANEDENDHLEPLINYVKKKYPQVHVINSLPLLIHLRSAHHQRFSNLFMKRFSMHHMSPLGNMFIAKLVYDELIKFPDLRGILTSSQCMASRKK